MDAHQAAHGSTRALRTSSESPRRESPHACFCRRYQNLTARHPDSPKSGRRCSRLPVVRCECLEELVGTPASVRQQERCARRDPSVGQACVVARQVLVAPLDVHRGSRPSRARGTLFYRGHEKVPSWPPAHAPTGRRRCPGTSAWPDRRGLGGQRVSPWGERSTVTYAMSRAGSRAQSDVLADDGGPVVDDGVEGHAEDLGDVLVQGRVKERGSNQPHGPGAIAEQRCCGIAQPHLARSTHASQRRAIPSDRPTRQPPRAWTGPLDAPRRTLPWPTRAVKLAPIGPGPMNARSSPSS